MRTITPWTTQATALATALVTALVAAWALGPPAWGVEARLLTQEDIDTMGGTDFDGGVGDYLLRNDRIEAVILAVGNTADFGIPFAPEGLPSRGVLIDAGTVGDRNDQLNEIHQILNLTGDSVVYYVNAAEGGVDPVLAVSDDGRTAAVTVSGIGLMEGVSSLANPTLLVSTTYSLTAGNSWIDLSTTVTNANAFPVPLFSIADIDILGRRNRIAFQPFPDRGSKPPPLDLADPFAGLGIWPYLAAPGNNGPEDGPVDKPSHPVAADRSVGEVCYALVPDSVATPLVGVANTQVAAASGFFDLAAVGAGMPPEVGPGASLTHDRKLVVTRGRSVEDCLDVVNPLLYQPVFGLDARATFTGRVVDSAGLPVSDTHIYFDNTFPGAPDYGGLVTLLDENQDGTADGVEPAVAGEPLPITQVEVAEDGTFTVRLQALADPSLAATVYRGTVYSPGRDPVMLPPLSVDAATLFGGPVDLGDIAVQGTGRLEVDVVRVFRRREDRIPVPARLTIYGRNGTANPDFGSQYLSPRRFSGLSRRDGDGLAPIVEGNSRQLSNSFNGLPALNFAADPQGHFELPLVPGDYTVYASRGLEHSLAMAEVTIVEGTETAVEMELLRTVTSDHYIAVDAHIHSTRSFDSSVPLYDLVTSYLSSGVEVMVSTDHDNVTDFSSAIADLGVGQRITSVIGGELSGGLPVPAGDVTGGIDAFPEGIGHWNGFPLSQIRGARRDGLPQDEFINPGTAIDRLRGMDSLPLLGVTPDTAGIGEWLAAIQAGAPGTVGEALPPDDEIVMLTHPRAGFAGLVVIGLLNSLANPGGDPLAGGFDPTLPVDAFPNSLMFLPSLYSQTVVGPAGTTTTGMSFDAIELINGTEIGTYLEVREDWFSLLNQGIHRVGTAVSDSHRPVLETPGFGRTYVRCQNRARPRLSGEDCLVESLRNLQAVGTTGPFIRLDVVGGSRFRDRFFDGIGQTFVVTGEKVVLRVRVEATPWIPVEELRIFRNGELAKSVPIAATKVLGGPSVRIQRKITLGDVDRDSWIVVEAGVRIDDHGDPVRPDLLATARRIVPELVPLGFTNPVFVDRDGDGYQPPGVGPATVP